MSVALVVRLRCDRQGCKALFARDADKGAEEVLRQARKLGWTHHLSAGDRRVDRCPKHPARPRPEETR